MLGNIIDYVYFRDTVNNILEEKTGLVQMGWNGLCDRRFGDSWCL